MDYINKIVHGDSLKVLRKIPSNTFDLLATDPPYQLDSIRKRFGKQGSVPAKPGKDGSFQRLSKGFMNATWDVLPSVDIWKECLRVLKPGAFGFIMCTPRQDSLLEMMNRLKEAGFVMGFTSIYWTYASGLVKAVNMPRLIDRRMGVKFKDENVTEMPKTTEFGSRFRNLRCDICGKPWISADPCTCDRSYKPVTDEAKAFKGSFPGFQPKPAVEVILVVMKPLSEPTYIDQALKNGKGVSWMDEGRIPVDPSVDNVNKITVRGKRQTSTWEDGSGFKNENNPVAGVTSKGRYPANLIVSDDVFHGVQDDGTKPHPIVSNVEEYKGWGSITQKRGEVVNYGDAGSYSRYFSLDAWTEKRCQFLVITKPDMWEKTMGLGIEPYKNPRPQGTAYNEEAPNGFKDVTEKRDLHATVKPIQLFSWLISMGSRPNDLVLDPFLGWGTTAIAAALFKRRFTGIEINAEYCASAQKRLKFALSHASHERFEAIREEIEPRLKTQDLEKFA